MRKDWCRALRKLRRKVRHKLAPSARRNELLQRTRDTTNRHFIGEVAMNQPELQPGS